MKTLGIDIGGGSIKVAMLQNDRVVMRSQSDFYSRPNRAQLMNAMRQCASNIHEVPDFIGICLPGLLDLRARRIVRSINVPGLEGMNVEELVNATIGKIIRPLQICNDAKATAVDAVPHLGYGERSICIVLGTGVGLAVLDGETFVEIDDESPGHLGQIDVSLDADPPIGADGGAGSLEAYIGSAALLTRYGNAHAFFDQLGVNAPPIRALARAIRICHAIYRPNHIVLAGGIGIRLRPIVGDLRNHVAKNLTCMAREGWTLNCAEHDFHAAIGAARLARQARES